jgi:pyruvate/2-oxoglutarate dehydrogenase complex dihydrolipoamide dehydrogenase (E3) component
VAGRADFAEPVRFLERELHRLGVTLHLNADVSIETVMAVDPDVAILATGGHRSVPLIPGSDLAHVMRSGEFLEHVERDPSGPLPDGVASADTVAVLGGSWVGCHIAGLLLERGTSVCVVEVRGSLAFDMGEQQGEVLRGRVSGHSESTVRVASTVERIGPGHIEIWDAARDQRDRLVADAAIVVERAQPNLELADAIRGHDAALPVFAIGDCVEPRRLADALREAAMLGASI